MTPGMIAALQQRRVLLCGLVRIALPEHVVTVCDGSATIAFGGEFYTGGDSLLGVLTMVSSVSETAGDSFPAITITFIPPPAVAAVDLLDPAWQGSQVRLWLAAIDRDTGEVIPEPDLLHAGEVDIATLTTDRGMRTLAIEVPSVFDRLFEPDEGARMADSFHQWVHPGELGFDQMTGTPIDRLWGPGQKNGGALVVR